MYVHFVHSRLRGQPKIPGYEDVDWMKLQCSSIISAGKTCLSRNANAITVLVFFVIHFREFEFAILCNVYLTKRFHFPVRVY
jgi:hypothetical protein